MPSRSSINRHPFVEAELKRRAREGRALFSAVAFAFVSFMLPAASSMGFVSSGVALAVFLGAAAVTAVFVFQA